MIKFFIENLKAKHYYSETKSFYEANSNLSGFSILGGETIKQINMQTGAHCEIDRRHNNTGTEKTFVIRGTTEQIENAKRMINEKLGFVC